ncbi:MAG: hypothetical protein HC903_29180 [Methylacidiphilales bacterium]|nr:hypothetical protein [Candidatus Methylacidiphilales bacterium]NJR19772.1 hypothetical protein [Calothrix sp. CSU_2_0]
MFQKITANKFARVASTPWAKAAGFPSSREVYMNDECCRLLTGNGKTRDERSRA